jgi:purine-binding chemotaxis protein CheW
MALKYDKQIAGFIADAVKEVSRVSPKIIDALTSIICKNCTEFIKGIVKFKNRLITLIETENIFTNNEKQILNDAA